MKKEEIFVLLNNFIANNPNPYVYGLGEKNVKKLGGENFKVLHSDSWKIGGRTGGSCWGDVANISVQCTDPEELSLLDEFLKNYFPQISYLKYKEILPFIKTFDFCVSEYYGNYTDYRISYISFEDIAKCLSTIEV